jgi:hypothetical protein
MYLDLNLLVPLLVRINLIPQSHTLLFLPRRLEDEHLEVSAWRYWWSS